MEVEDGLERGRMLAARDNELNLAHSIGADMVLGRSFEGVYVGDGQSFAVALKHCVHDFELLNLPVKGTSLTWRWLEHVSLALEPAPYLEYSLTPRVIVAVDIMVDEEIEI